VQQSSGGVVRAWAVQTLNIAGLRGREADSDAVARRLNELLQQRTAFSEARPATGSDQKAVLLARRRAAVARAAVFVTYFVIRLVLVVKIW
jgi:hypothetical protein